MFIRFLPSKLITQLAGFLSVIRFPKFLLIPFLLWYCKKYGVNKSEMRLTLLDYASFRDFFVRELKPAARVFDIAPNIIVSPVDGMVSQQGDITKGKLMQVKGLDYKLSNLVGKANSKVFAEGKYITIYLSPGDYHRIHSPVDGKVVKSFYFPGKFFPVNNWATNNIKNLFCFNERVLTFIKTDKGLLGVLKVGALVVGKIPLSYKVKTQDKTTHKNYYENLMESDTSLLVGSQLAQFELGSTLILLFPKDSIKILSIANKKIKLGQKIASWV